jgi:hypothetical protein
MVSRRHALLSLLASLPAAHAGTEAAPAVLTVRGRTAGGKTLDFTMPDLDRLPQRRFTTKSPWTQEAHTYQGPLLRDVLDAAGAQGRQLRAAALNDYRVLIPAEDAREHDVIVATRIDGKPIPVRGRGPLFVIYPFDEKPDLRKAAYFERSIWQLRSIEVE